MNIKTLKDLKEIKGKKILLRVDFNVPLTEDGKVQDDTRIVESLETIKLLKDKGAKIIIVSHLGRPDGKVKEELRLTEVAKHLEKLLKHKVKKLDAVLDKTVKTDIEKMKDGEILMLENVRFRAEEEKCDKEFSKELASLADIFVNDAFGTAHRAHSSTSGVAEFIPAYAGFLMEREINALSPLLENEPMRPLTLIFGGAKIDTKIGIINHFLNKADYFLIGGAIANTFLFAAGYNVGQSLYEKDKKDIAQKIMLTCEKDKEKFVIPHDVVVASEISDKAETANIPIEDVLGDMKILDIGKWTAEKYANIIQESGTVIWNGPMGLCEYKPFQEGTRVIAKAIATHDCKSIIGGGDTIDSIRRVNIPGDNFSHVSTGGGASIEFLSGLKLPGIECLKR